MDQAKVTHSTVMSDLKTDAKKDDGIWGTGSAGGLQLDVVQLVLEHARSLESVAFSVRDIHTLDDILLTYYRSTDPVQFRRSYADSSTTLDSGSQKAS